MNSVIAFRVRVGTENLVRPILPKVLGLDRLSSVDVPPHRHVEADESPVGASLDVARIQSARLPRFVGRDYDASTARVMDDPVESGRSGDMKIIEEQVPVTFGCHSIL